MSVIHVVKRDGTKEPFDANKINIALLKAAEGLPDQVSKVVQVATELQLTLFDGITTEQLDQAVIQTTLQNVKDDPDYDKIAARLLLKTIYKSILGDYQSVDELKKLHAKEFPKFVKAAVKEGLLDTRMADGRFDLKRLGEALDPAKDDLSKYLGVITNRNRYALRKQNGQPMETPQFTHMRIAMGLSYNEKDPTAAAIAFYNHMSSLEYVPGGSTRVNAGGSFPQLSNCFLLNVDDDMESIAKAVRDTMWIAKGTGKKAGAAAIYMENWHLNFPQFIDLRSNSGDPYMRTRFANTAVFISDEFMKRVQKDQDWYLFDPADTPDLPELYGEEFSARYKEYIKLAEAGKMRVFEKTSARQQFKQILTSLQATSHPWLTWKDTINVRALNNNTGTIHLSNLCTEITLPQDKDNIATCNLISINLSAFLNKDKTWDWDRLKEASRAAVRQLDNLVDITKTPITEAMHSNNQTRAIGLGLMGFTDVLEKLGYCYESTESYNLIDKLTEFISYHAIDQSADLAQELGSYPTYKGSGWSKGILPIDTLETLSTDRKVKVKIDHKSSLDWDALRVKVKKGMRNATLMAIAPTANIGHIAGTTPGIDPQFAQIFSRSTLNGKFLEVNNNLVRDLKALNLWDDIKEEVFANQGDIQHIDAIPQKLKDVYKTSFQLSPYAFIEVAARAQKWVDQAISRNMYLETRDIDEYVEIYSEAWRRGLKTTYYLHVKPRHQSEQTTVSVEKIAEQKIRTGAGKARGFGFAKINK